MSVRAFFILCLAILSACDSSGPIEGDKDDQDDDSTSLILDTLDVSARLQYYHRGSADGDTIIAAELKGASLPIQLDSAYTIQLNWGEVIGWGIGLKHSYITDAFPSVLETCGEKINFVYVHNAVGNENAEPVDFEEPAEKNSSVYERCIMRIFTVRGFGIISDDTLSVTRSTLQNGKQVDQSILVPLKDHVVEGGPAISARENQIGVAPRDWISGTSALGTSISVEETQRTVLPIQVFRLGAIYMNWRAADVSIPEIGYALSSNTGLRYFVFLFDITKRINNRPIAARGDHSCLLPGKTTTPYASLKLATTPDPSLGRRGIPSLGRRGKEEPPLTPPRGGGENTTPLTPPWVLNWHSILKIAPWSLRLFDWLIFVVTPAKTKRYI